MSETKELSRQAEQIRREFDEAFASPLPELRQAPEGFLLVRVGAGRYALPLRELSGLDSHRKIVPLPGAPAGLRGLAGLQGRIVPVYSLAWAIGENAGGDHWLAMCGRDQPVALSFDSFEGHHISAAGERVMTEESGRGQDYLSGAIHIDDELIAVLEVRAILDRIIRQSGRKPSMEVHE